MFLVLKAAPSLESRSSRPTRRSSKNAIRLERSRSNLERIGSLADHPGRLGTSRVKPAARFATTLAAIDAVLDSFCDGHRELAPSRTSTRRSTRVVHEGSSRMSCGSTRVLAGIEEGIVSAPPNPSHRRYAHDRALGGRLPQVAVSTRSHSRCRNVLSLDPYQLYRRHSPAVLFHGTHTVRGLPLPRQMHALRGAKSHHPLTAGKRCSACALRKGIPWIPRWDSRLSSSFEGDMR